MADTFVPAADFVFISADGDNMGAKVAKAILANDAESAKKVSQSIIRGELGFVKEAKKRMSAEVIIAGGDDILLKVPAKQFNVQAIDWLRSSYPRATSGGTITVGIGNDMIQSHKALVVGKSTGKNKAVYWTPDVDKDYEKYAELEESADVVNILPRYKASGSFDVARRVLRGLV